ncbi:hypothetical protein RRG08_020804 [Elysia crispata]|uniref:Uncharacterized protein n=1 Tax=Elysia crispata TaxID=231223 RepID=A0AAE0YQP9_9GAST|nr:hypothetical protein RRG08_020804 [Elysia crispata]
MCVCVSVFKDHFDCVSQFGPRISSCILLRTQLFRNAVTAAGLVPHKTLHDITCNFAENIVMCLERPLSRACPLTVVETMTSALHRFLPPACAPVPAVFDREFSHTDPRSEVPSGTHLTEPALPVEQGTPELAESEQEPMHLETIIVEGGDAEN